MKDTLILKNNGMTRAMLRPTFQTTNMVHLENFKTVKFCIVHNSRKYMYMFLWRIPVFLNTIGRFLLLHAIQVRGRYCRKRIVQPTRVEFLLYCSSQFFSQECVRVVDIPAINNCEKLECPIDISFHLYTKHDSLIFKNIELIWI